MLSFSRTTGYAILALGCIGSWKGQRVLSGHVVATDDTVMPLLAPEKTRQARLWIYRGEDANPYNVFDFTLSRGRDGPDQFLGDFQGTLLADAYGGYEGICTSKQIPQAGCWAHARRKFVDAEAAGPPAATRRMCTSISGRL